jgi:hypothetical protein
VTSYPSPKRFIYFNNPLLLVAFHLQTVQIKLYCLLQFKINFTNSEFCSNLVGFIGRGIGLFKTWTAHIRTAQGNADMHPWSDLVSKSQTSDQRWTVNFTSFFFHRLYTPLGPWPLIFSFLIILQTLGLLGRVISSSQGLYRNTGQHKHRINTYTYQTSMPCMGFEPTIPASERAKTVHTLDSWATVTGKFHIILEWIERLSSVYTRESR